MPGSPLDPRARGTNALLKQGAAIVTEARDVLDVLSPLTGDLLILPATQRTDLLSGLDEDGLHAAATSDVAETTDLHRDRVVDALGPVPVDLDTLVRHTGLDAAQLQLILLELDLAGRILRHPGNRIALKPV